MRRYSFSVSNTTCACFSPFPSYFIKRRLPLLIVSLVELAMHLIHAVKNDYPK